MIDFEEEVKKFQPSLEVEDAEDAIRRKDLTDMTDILRQMMQQSAASSNRNAYQNGTRR